MYDDIVACPSCYFLTIAPLDPLVCENQDLVAVSLAIRLYVIK